VRTDIEENLVTHRHTCASVVEAYLKRPRCHKAPGPHDQLAAGCLVELYMLRTPTLDHIALTLADPCHVGREWTADHRPELGGVTRQMRDPRAPNKQRPLLDAIPALPANREGSIGFFDMDRSRRLSLALRRADRRRRAAKRRRFR
jgi:hypothetical protein